MYNEMGRVPQGVTKGSSYAETHAVAADAQRRNVQWIAYESVRSPECSLRWYSTQTVCRSV